VFLKQENVYKLKLIPLWIPNQEVTTMPQKNERLIQTSAVIAAETSTVESANKRKEEAKPIIYINRI
jgi:hypothetical protein